MASTAGAAAAAAGSSVVPQTGLAGKVAIVTGGSRGIGAGIAKSLGALGAKVVVNYNGNASAAAEVVAAIKASGSEAVAVQGDVSKSADVEGLFAAAEKQFGRVNIVVNNAAIAPMNPIASVSDEEFDQLIGVNLKGAFLVLREAARRITDGGRIINVSTVLTRLAYPGTGVYAATKAALEQLSRVLAAELGSRQITVNSVLPGPTATDLFLGPRNEEEVKKAAAMSPFGRIGEPQDIANTVVFLASDAAGWVTGQNIGANGGVH